MCVCVYILVSLSPCLRFFSFSFVLKAVLMWVVVIKLMSRSNNMWIVSEKFNDNVVVFKMMWDSKYIYIYIKLSKIFIININILPFIYNRLLFVLSYNTIYCPWNFTIYKYFWFLLYLKRANIYSKFKIYFCY